VESPKDQNGIAVKGDAILQDTRNCLVHSNERLAATIGLEDIVIVDIKDAVMVDHKDKIQDVKAIVANQKLLTVTNGNHIMKSTDLGGSMTP
jgi:hypothetical protein